jgi:hypothetical protein
MTCKKAKAVANEMKEKFKNQLEIKCFTTDSMEALKYHFRSATNVLFENELVPIEIATDPEKMAEFLTGKISKII